MCLVANRPDAMVAAGRYDCYTYYFVALSKICALNGIRFVYGVPVAVYSLVTKDKVVKSGELWGGRPAKFMRKLTDAEIKEITDMAQRYVEWSKEYL